MGTGLAEQAGAEHHQVGLALAERVVVESEALHGLGREVLGDGLGPFVDQAPGQPDAPRVLQVERDAELADVEGVEHLRGVEAGGGVRAQEIRAAPGLELDDRGPVLGEVAGGDGAGRA